jgi:hypothetical protein
MISKSREVGVHIPSLLEKLENEVDKWWFGQMIGAIDLLLCTYLIPLRISVVDVVWHLSGERILMSSRGGWIDESALIKNFNPLSVQKLVRPVLLGSKPTN